MPRFTLTPIRAVLLTFVYLFLWQLLTWGLPALEVYGGAALIEVGGWAGFYLIGLAWTVWWLERIAQRLELRRQLETEDAANQDDRVDSLRSSVCGEVSRPRRRIWNPLDPAAWFYGREGQRLKQSLLALSTYSLFFIILYWVIHLSFGGPPVDPFDLPPGSGQEVMRQTVKIQKVIRKKFVINPYSSIHFAPPPIENVDVQLEKETRNEYQVGQGSEGGDAVGVGGGSEGGYGGKGKQRFVRLRHSDRGWDRNFGIGGDKNILLEMQIRNRMPKDRIADETEAIDADQIARLAKDNPMTGPPPLLYIAGTNGFSLAQGDKKILKDYLLESHGMILGDNLGGQAFHNQFITAMNELTGVTPVAIPRDDYIHKVPRTLPELPIVVAHGGTVPLGWKVDGRWVVYYHPGALSDAWRDDHAGIKKDIYELCYQLGVNIISYANAEKAKWIRSRKP